MGINLEDYRYKRLSDYMGPDWYEYYAVAGQSRDSDALERANFKAWVQDMEEYVDLYYYEDRSRIDIDDVFHVIRDSHWAVGWVETLYVHQDAPEEMLDRVRENLEALENYPILDEELWSEVEREDEEEYLEIIGFHEIADRYNLFTETDEDKEYLKDMVYDFLSNDILLFEHDSGGPYLVGEEEIEDENLQNWFPFKVTDPWFDEIWRFRTHGQAQMAVLNIVQERHRAGDLIELLDFGWTLGFRIAPNVGTWEVVRVVR